MAKLSKEAAKRKAVRDKKAAMTPARRKKKAENQRIRRAAADKHGKSWLNGKDYDHDDKRFESIKANRGNDGNGTKKESNKTTRKTKTMAFKLRSPLRKEDPKFGEVPIASGDKSFGGYQSKLKSQMMSTKNPADSGVGTYPDPQTGKRTYYDKKHQSYSAKTGMVNKTGSFKDGKYVLNKPEPKAKSFLPASQGGSPMAYRGSGNFKSVTSSDNNTLRTSGPKELRPGGGVRRSTITSEGYKIPGTSDNKRPEYEIPGTGSSAVKPKTKTNTNTTKSSASTKPKSSASTKAKPAAKPISSRDSGDRSGGYLKDTRNFSLGVDLSMPRSKMQTTVSNARSTGNNLIGGRLSRRGKIAARQVAKTSRVKERVGNQIERIKGRQVRAGVRAGAKMARRDKGVDPGYFDSQKKLDAFEKSIDSPKATPRTSGAGNISSGSKMPSLRTPKSNQTVAKPSVRLNTSTQTSKTIPDSKIKKGAKKASGGRKVSSDTYKNLTGFSKMTPKPGLSGGMQRGMTRVDQTKKLTNLASGNQPRKDVKNMSSKNYLTRGIKPSYKK